MTITVIYDIWLEKKKSKRQRIRSSTTWMSQVWVLLWLYGLLTLCGVNVFDVSSKKHWDHPITSLHASSQIRSNTANGNHKAALLGAMSLPSNPNFSWVACSAAKSAAGPLTVHCCMCTHPSNNSTIVCSPYCPFSSGLTTFSFLLSYLNSVCTY